MPFDPADFECGSIPLQLRRGAFVTEEFRVLNAGRQVIGIFFVTFPVLPDMTANPFAEDHVTVHLSPNDNVPLKSMLTPPPLQ